MADSDVGVRHGQAIVRAFGDALLVGVALAVVGLVLALASRKSEVT